MVLTELTILRVEGKFLLLMYKILYTNLAYTKSNLSPVPWGLSQETFLGQRQKPLTWAGR